MPSASPTAALLPAATCRSALYPGEVLAIVGESGSGKSTLLQLLSAPARAERRAGVVPDARRRDPRSRRARRGRAALAVPHRLGLCASGSGAGPAHGGLGRRQCRRAADGGGLEPLRPHPRDRLRLARPRRDRRRPHRRCAAHLFRRHAPAPADRAQPRHRAAAGVHGRADRRPRCLGAGAPARSDAQARQPNSASPRSSSPTISRWRGCCRIA